MVRSTTDRQQLRELRKRLTAFRSRRASNNSRTWIPPEIWNEAAALAQNLGVPHVAAQLKLERKKLQSLIEQQEGSDMAEAAPEAQTNGAVEAPWRRQINDLDEAFEGVEVREIDDEDVRLPEKVSIQLDIRVERPDGRILEISTTTFSYDFFKFVLGFILDGEG